MIGGGSTARGARNAIMTALVHAGSTSKSIIVLLILLVLLIGAVRAGTTSKAFTIPIISTVHTRTARKLLHLRLRA